MDAYYEQMQAHVDEGGKITDQQRTELGIESIKQGYLKGESMKETLNLLWIHHKIYNSPAAAMVVGWKKESENGN